MFLVLFSIQNRDFFVISDPGSEAKPSFVKGAGLVAKVAGKIYTAYESLRERFDYQENVCAMLRHVSELTLVHSESLDPLDADQRFRLFLNRRRSRHRNWMWIDIAVAVAASVLTPIPGPNVFFLYPAARALSHFFAAKGIDKARQLKVLCYECDSKIDHIQNHLGSLDEVSQAIQDVEQLYHLSKLRVHLEKI